jgi:hypothetical protein
VTDHLQLLLRKAGHHLHTTAEREVVKTIKEKCCYIAANPAKEEKEALGRHEDFRLPDGQVVQVRRPVRGHLCAILMVHTCSWAPSGFERQKFFSIQSSSVKNMLVFTRSSLTRSIELILICAKICSPTSFSAAGVHSPAVRVSHYLLLLDFN